MNAREGFLNESKSIANVINGSIGIIKTSKNLDTIQSRYDVIIECVDRLIEIFNMGFSFTDKNPNDMKNQFPGAVNSRFLELAENIANDTIAKRDSIITIKEGLKLLEKAKTFVLECRNRLYKKDEEYDDYFRKIDKILIQLKKEIIVGQIKELLEKADKEEFKGNHKKAKDIYMEALYLARNNEFSKEFSSQYEESIQKKIQQQL
jgi:hypothetical protein